MGVTTMRARSAWRRRTGSLLLFTALVAFVGAVVLTATAGARRARTTVDRYARADASPDLLVAFTEFGNPPALAALQRDPRILDSGVAAMMTVLPMKDGAPTYAPLVAPVDATFAQTLFRGVLIAGRRPDPHASDEVLLSEADAKVLHAPVGTNLPLVAFTAAQAERCLRGDASPPDCRALVRKPNLAVRVVGVVRTDTDISLRTEDVGFAMLTKGFYDKYHDRIASNRVAMFKLRPGVPVGSYAEHVRSVLGSTPADVQTFSSTSIRATVNVMATGLFLFALVAVIAGAFAIGQAVVRQVGAAANERMILGALGMTRRGRVRDAIAPLALSGAVATMLAVATSYAVSTTMPVGLARRIEPHRGRDFDVTVMLGGAVACILFIGVVAAMSALRPPSRPGTRPARFTDHVAAAMPPSIGVGVGNAFSTRRGGVPARAAIAGVAAATAGVVAVVLFGAGLDHLVHTPATYGWGWDAMDIVMSPANLTRLQQDSDIDAIATLERRGQVRVENTPTLALAVRPVRGEMGPTMVAGRAPERTGEVALGRDTLRAAHARVGSTVSVKGQNGTLPLRVVGLTVFPTGNDGDAIAEGAFMTAGDRRRLVGPADSGAEAAGTVYYGVRFRPGVDRTAAEQRLQRILPAPDEFTPAFTRPTPPAEVDKVRQVRTLPNVLAVFLAALGVVALVHALVVGVRRRRRDYAVLRAMGFRRRDVRRSIASESVALGAAGAVVGVPLGVLVGRFAWSRVAGSIGVLVERPLVLPALVLAVPVVVVVALLIAWLPARRALRSHPGTVLRTE